MRGSDCYLSFFILGSLKRDVVCRKLLGLAEHHRLLLSTALCFSTSKLCSFSYLGAKHSASWCLNILLRRRLLNFSRPWLNALHNNLICRFSLRLKVGTWHACDLIRWLHFKFTLSDLLLLSFSLFSRLSLSCCLLNLVNFLICGVHLKECV